MQNGAEDIFVFVACGSNKYIETLNFSLSYLRYFKANKIYVVTDLERNEQQIGNDNIIDVSTNKELDNHQASIFLKTSLHKILPAGNNYCYLDSDVIAVTDNVNEIFSHKQGIISFTSDHCRLKRFSPSAVNCGCLSNNKQQVEILEALLNKYDLNRNIKDEKRKELVKILLGRFQKIKSNKPKYMLTALRYFLSINRFSIDKDFYYKKKEKTWFYKDGQPVMYDFSKISKNIETESDFKWSRWRRTWVDKKGKNIWKCECSHLAQFINKKFGISIGKNNWQHWNGGVFLFDDQSHDFMESWHTKVLSIFKDQAWVTRDQGALVATVWEFGLEKETTLPIAFNFIADYNHPTMIYKRDFTFDVSEDLKNIQPYFIHIYHHWGDEDWNVWKDIISLL